ncbi:MAG: hypothetical protein F9K44_05110 [Hyphomicrobiaceae bacterium]|nr:MAG: hypothetical protein F9K44_05110 [Hyphomicrobiaceae bacterium]
MEGKNLVKAEQSVSKSSEDATMRPEMLPTDIKMILKEINEKPDARDELYLKLKERLEEMRECGAAIPKDVVTLERNLATELMSEAQGR